MQGGKLPARVTLAACSLLGCTARGVSRLETGAARAWVLVSVGAAATPHTFIHAVSHTGCS